ncbi:MAG: FtsX-like permease family protein, partial [Candidatus Thorarchaeota archaeon]
LTILISISIIIIFPVGFINSGPSLVTSLDQESTDSHLAHLEIFFLGIPDQTISEINNLVNPVDINGRIRITGIIDNKLVDNQKQEVYLVSYPKNNSPSVNIPKVREGNFSATSGTCGILESFAKYLHVDIGDKLVIKARNTTETLTISGFLSSVEFMSYDILGEGVIYVNYQDAAQLAGLATNSSTNLYNDVVLYFGSSQQVTTDFLKEKVKLIEDHFEKDLDPLNDPQFIWFTQKSSVRASLAEGADLIGKYLGAAATFAVLVTGFVIFIIMNRYINEEKKLIGVYHSFGFTKLEIIYIYAGKAFLLGIGSIILGSIGALIILYMISSTIANIWGITELYLTMQIETLIIFWILALACSLTFAVIPCIQAANLTPYEALREIRKIGVPGKGILSRFAGYLGSIPKMSIRTLARNRIRTLLTVIGIVGAMALSIALLSALSSVNYTVDNYFQHNLLFDGRIEYYDNQNISELNYIQNQTGVTHAEPNYYYLTNPLNDISEVVSIRGVPVNSQNFIPDILEKDPNFTFEKNNNYTNQALVSERVLKRLNLKIGDNLIVRWKPGGLLYSNLTFKIMGMIRDFEYSIGVYVALPYLTNHLQNPSNYFNAITVKLEKNISRSFVNNQLLRSKVSYVTHIENIKSNVDRIINSQIFIVSITVLLGFIVAFISVFNTQYITIIERDRDISIMLAFGYSRRFFLLEFLLEIFILVPISIILAIIVSRPIAQIFLNLIEDSVVRMDYYLGQSEILFSFAFVLITAFTAAVIPAYYFVSTKRLSNILRADE